MLHDSRQVQIKPYIKQCQKIVKDLCNFSAAKYVIPDVDLIKFSDYTAKIPTPISINIIKTKLNNNQYIYLNDFSFDIRLVCSNFINYNYYSSTEYVKLRKDIVRVLYKFESQRYELQQEMELTQPNMYFSQPLKELKSCLQAFEDTIQVLSSISFGDTITSYAIDTFIFPISHYFTPVDYKRYINVIKQPICYSDIIYNLVTCQYDNIQQVLDDIELIVQNCSQYWSTKINAKDPNSKLYIKDAMTLQDTFLKSFNRYSQDNSLDMPRIELQVKKQTSTTSNILNATLPSTSVTPISAIKTSKINPELVQTSLPEQLVNPTEQLSNASILILERKVDKIFRLIFKLCLDSVKEHYLIGSIRVQTAYPFLKAVDTVKFPDYALIITDPMDLGRIEKKLNNDRYSCLSANGGVNTAIHSIINDVKLIRDNAHLYNTGMEGLEVRIMADCILHYFRYLLSQLLKILLRSSGDAKLQFIIFHNHTNEATTIIDELLSEEVAEDVQKYLSSSGVTIESLLAKTELSQLLKYSDTTTNTTTTNSNNNNTINNTNTSNTSVQEGLNSTSSNVMKKNINNTSLTIHKNTNTITSNINSINNTNIETMNHTTTNIVNSSNSTTANSTILYNNHTSIIQDGAVDVDLISSHDRNSWEFVADNILRLLQRHVYVDVTKPTVIADFNVPVILANPLIEEDYKRIIKFPMDLGTLKYQLDTCSIISSPDDFYTKLVSVFQNTIEYNNLHQDSIYAIQLVHRCKILVNYTSWLCLEYLPVKDDLLEPLPLLPEQQMVENLLKSKQVAARKIREDILSNAVIREIGSSPYTECKKLLKDLERCRTNAERIQVSYFITPVNTDLVPQYSVYVRSAIDLSTIKFKLDGTLPSSSTIVAAINKHTPRYEKYGEFVNDLRRVFTNAIKFNKAFLESDHTGVSVKVYEAAMILQEKLENLLHIYTIHLADRIERIKLINQEIYEQECLQRSKEEEERKAYKLIEQSILEKWKAEDKVFAADFDVERKSKLTEEQLKQEFAQRPHDDLDTSSGDMSPKSNPILTIQFKKPEIKYPLIYGFGVSGTVPNKFKQVINDKLLALNSAWDAWLPVSVNSKMNKRKHTSKDHRVKKQALIRKDTLQEQNILVSHSDSISYSDIKKNDVGLKMELDNDILLSSTSNIKIQFDPRKIKKHLQVKDIWFDNYD